MNSKIALNRITNLNNMNFTIYIRNHLILIIVLNNNSKFKKPKWLIFQCLKYS